MVRLDREKLDVDVVTDVVAQKNESDLIKVIDVTNVEPGIQNSSRMEVDEPLITSDDKEKSEPMDSASLSQLWLIKWLLSFSENVICIMRSGSGARSNVEVHIS